MAKKYTRQVPPTPYLNKEALPGRSSILHLEAPQKPSEFKKHSKALAAAIGPWGGSHLEILAHYAGKCAEYLRRKKIKPEGTAYVTASKVYRHRKPDAEKILHEIPSFPDSPPTDGATPEAMAVRAIGFFLAAIEGSQDGDMDLAVRNSLGAMDAYWRLEFAVKYEPLVVANVRDPKGRKKGNDSKTAESNDLRGFVNNQAAKLNRQNPTAYKTASACAKKIISDNKEKLEDYKEDTVRKWIKLENSNTP